MFGSSLFPVGENLNKKEVFVLGGIFKPKICIRNRESHDSAFGRGKPGKVPAKMPS